METKATIHCLSVLFSRQPLKTAFSLQLRSSLIRMGDFTLTRQPFPAAGEKAAERT
jgi:hypothetical protein